MITIKDLSNYYNGRQMLKHIDLHVKQGDFLALFGEEGAGKTTLLHILMGFLTRYEGSAQVFGKDAKEWNAKERSRVRFVPDDILWEKHMTGKEYLAFARSAAASYDEELQKELCREFEVPLDMQLLDLSYQENKFVQIIAAVCAKPGLLILDEPVHFIALQEYRRLLDWLQKWNRQGMTILLAVSGYRYAERYCRSYAYLKEGRLTHTGSVSETDVRWKVITVAGKVPEAFQNAMDQCVSEQKYGTSFLYCGDMGKLSSLLGSLGSMDYKVEEMLLEEELEQDFSRWE